MSPTRYYQTLNALLDLPQALSYDPVLVHRLRRVRTARAARPPSCSAAEGAGSHG